MNQPAKVWTAADVMRPAVFSVPSTMPLPEFQEALIEHRISGCPVIDNGRLVGIASRADIVRQLCTEREVAEKTSDFYFDETGFHEDTMDSPEEIAERIGERIEGLSVGDVMTRNPATIPLDLPVIEIARRLIDARIHRLPVTDGETFVGMVTTSDLVRMIADGRLVAR